MTKIVRGLKNKSYEERLELGMYHAHALKRIRPRRIQNLQKPGGL